MRTRIALLVLAVVVVMAFAVPVAAQDDMMTHTCDSTLILLLYLAEHDYGFHSMMDVSTFEKGQYAPLFDDMMAMMDDMMESEDDMMDESDDMMMDDDMMEGDMMMLAPGNVEGEDPACTELRAELEAFFYETLTMGMMSEEMGS